MHLGGGNGCGWRNFPPPPQSVAGVLASDTSFHTELERAKRATNLRAKPAFVLGGEAPRICIFTFAQNITSPLLRA